MQPPVLGEIQAKVMYCSGLSADNPSLNHQDPFIHPYGSQLTANEQPAMWCRGPVSHLLRQVGLTVDIFYLPVSTRVMDIAVFQTKINVMGEMLCYHVSLFIYIPAVVSLCFTATLYCLIAYHTLY